MQQRSSELKREKKKRKQREKLKQDKVFDKCNSVFPKK